MNKPTTVDEYIGLTSPEVRAELERVRELVKQLAPDAEESLSYNMPTFKYKGRPLVYLTASRSHMSFYPSTLVIEELRDKLDGFKTTKHSVHFTLEKPLPDALIKEMVLTHARLIDSGKKKFSP